jgi:hypothetical protein
MSIVLPPLGERRNAIERAMLLADSEYLTPDAFTTLTRSVAAMQFRPPAEDRSCSSVPPASHSSGGHGPARQSA